MDGTGRHWNAGDARYQWLVWICRSYGVLTPEDPFPLWTGEGGEHRIAPLFVGYDYTFHPDDVRTEDAVAWAMEAGILCADEHLLHPDPYPSRAAWCHARCAITEARLEAVADGPPLVLINHFPLRKELVRLHFIPRFSIWCGTRRTEDWHRRFNARVVVSGHLHIPTTDWIDGVRFEEVSFGYPKQWQRRSRDLGGHLREILPGPPTPASGFDGPIVYR